MPRFTLFCPFAAPAPPVAPAAAAAAPTLTVEALQANPLVPGVSMIADGPAKGHSFYDEANDQMVPVFIDQQTRESVLACAALYAGGLRVNAGHFTGILEAVGRLNAYRQDGPKLRADLGLFRTFSQFDHLAELICTIPDTFGLSIDFDGAAEVLDGKAFPRCTEIYSCDLVPTPAANEGGLFGAALPPAVAQKLRRYFDNLPPSNMPPEPATPPAPAAPAAPAPAAPKPAEPAAPAVSAEVKAEITTAVTGAITTALEPIKTELGGITQRLTKVEADLAADAAADDAVPTTANPAPQMGALRKRVLSLERQIGATGQKLARRFGLEFAARAGANPVENPTGATTTDPGTDTRKAFEIPTAERNAAQLRAMGIGK